MSVGATETHVPPCEEARAAILDLDRGRLPPDRADVVRAHLDRCAACQAIAHRERALDEVLSRRLAHRAPPALTAALRARFGVQRAASTHRSRRWPFVLAAAIAVLIAGLTPVYYQRVVIARAHTATLENEAVNDHLRILDAQHPLDVQSGGMHQVKPWFAGKLDFAPVLAFTGDDAFPLQGGSVGWFLDRKAAIFVFKRRLHMISLVMVRVEGLDFPVTGEPMGRVRARLRRVRGFTLVTWRDGDLGYALISDIDGRELLELGARIAGGPEAPTQ